ncbi:MAG TPA: hypothetical protein VMY42_13810 [Thermoguttaceae bacterium]|nr:hypothetical protein [Thermoguttaceae bacterium]
MSDAFDPYHAWLGIPPREQPANHYRLLGIPEYEDNPSVIENAADRQMMHLRTHQTGKHSKLSQRLLNEVAAAKVCLLNPRPKAEYDEQLREKSKPKKLAKRHTRRWVKTVLPAVAGLLLVVVAIVWAVLPDGEPLAQSPESDAGHGASPPSNEPPIEPFVQPVGEPAEPVPEDSPPEVLPPHGEPEEPPGISQQPPDPQGHEPESPPESPPDVQPPAVTPKHPIPSAEAQQKILAQLDEVYDLGQARTAGQKRELASELLNMGARTQANMDERFVVLRKAMELAAEVGDVPTMFDAIDAIAVEHDVDVLSVKAKMLVRLAAEADAAATGSLMGGARHVIDQALSADRYDLASTLADAAVGLADRPGGAGFREEALDRQTRLQRITQDFERFQQAQTALQTSPDDADAHLEVGRWYCFTKDEWDRGIPHLAKGSDQRLRALAVQEPAPRPSGAADLVDLADAWWDLAQGTTGEDHDAIMLRAGHWYKAAQEAGLVALARVKAERRLAEIAELKSAAAPSPGGIPVGATGPAVGDSSAAALLADAWQQIRRGAGQTARETLAAAAKQDPDDFRVDFTLGLLDALYAHDWQSAQRCFTKCVRRHPAHVPSLNNLALVSIRLKDTSEAIQSWRTAVEASPKAPTEVVRNLARLQYLVNQTRLVLSPTLSKALDKLCETAPADGAGLPPVTGTGGWQFMGLEAAEGPSLGWPDAVRYLDRWCVTCNGVGAVSCPFSGCARGSVRAYRTETVGVNPISGVPITRRVAIRVPCGYCRGNGQIDCPHCEDGKDPSMLPIQSQ